MVLNMAEVAGKVPLTYMNRAWSFDNLMRLRIKHKNWATVRSLGTKYLFLSISGTSADGARSTITGTLLGWLSVIFLYCSNLSSKILKSVLVKTSNKHSITEGIGRFEAHSSRRIIFWPENHLSEIQDQKLKIKFTESGELYLCCWCLKTRASTSTYWVN